MRVLVVNAGSSSLKHALVDAAGGQLLTHDEERWEPSDDPGRHAAALARALTDAGQVADAVGHRVVHGGPNFHGPVLIDDTVREQIAGLAPLAPLHTRAALEGIDTARTALPELPQVASFDTAFHHTLPRAAATYALPRSWIDRYGLRRYGFHGLNVQWCSERAAALLGRERSRRLVVCHLGSGCSATAVLDGRSVDTSMGLTPLDGVPMATRSGAVDPGLLLHLLEQGLTPAELADGLNHRAGLRGLAGVSGGVRAAEAAADAGDPAARLALDVLTLRVAGAIAALTVSLGGLDALVFSGGAGERSPALRVAVAARLGHLGVALDARRNADPAAEDDIAVTDAGVRVLVIAAGEEVVIARETAAVLAARSGP